MVNENDTVETQELEGKNFGDNDTLSAVVAGLCGAQGLIILTDIDGLYDGTPGKTRRPAHPPGGGSHPPAGGFGGGAGSSGAPGHGHQAEAAKLAKSQGIPRPSSVEAT